MLAVYAIVETSTYAWGSAHTVGFGGLAVALLVAFVIRQATRGQPADAARGVPLARPSPERTSSRC